jgi:molybdopterin/thiamine biosynthesis adenylyltransferase
VSVLEQQAKPYVHQIGGVRTISLEDLDRLAADRSLSRREAEIAMLRLGILPRRYLRNLGTVGLAGQLALLQSCVAVIGLGGLGGYAVEGLARMGVGRLVLVDGDVFLDHNLNRQTLSLEERLGEPKCAVAEERVRRVNRAVEVETRGEYATADNLQDILAGVDVVIDALDRLPTRMLLQRVAAQVGVPMVHGAIAGGMGQVMTILPGDLGLRALYGDGPVPEQGAETELGTPAPTPMMVAALQVHEAIKILTGKGELLRGRILFIDAMSGDVHVLGLQARGDNPP